MSPIDAVFSNLENGNLSDAKHRAKRYSLDALYAYARESLSWSDTKAETAANYLKGKGTFQAYADSQ